MLICNDSSLLDSSFSSKLAGLLDIKAKAEMSISGLQESDIYYKQFGIYIKRSEHYNFLIKTHSTECFRPGQEDISHIELWVDNENVLLDSGSFISLR